MINLYCGRSNVDRGKFIYENAARYKAEGKTSALIIVPDQYTLEAEREAFRILKTKGLMDIQIMSFSRLALKLVGQKTGKKYIDDTGRSMLLRKVISENKDKLSIFASAAEKTQFVKMTGSMIQEFKQYKVSPERLKELVRENKEKYTNRMLIKKLEDASVIYEAYEEEIKGKYFDTEDYISQLCQEIPNSELFENAQVWIEGFDFFSKRLLSVVEEILLKAKEVNIVLNYTLPGNRDYNLFAPVEATIEAFKKIAMEAGTEAKLFGIPEEYLKKQPEDLSALHRELYSFPVKTYEKAPVNIKLLSCENKEAEISEIASEIRRLVDEEGYRFKDIMVAANDLDQASTLIDRFFTPLGISFFDGRKASAVCNKYMQFLMAICSGENIYNSTDQMLRILHTHIPAICGDEAELLENYVMRYGVEGSLWKKDFYKLDEHGISEEEAEKQLAELDGIRHRLVSVIDKLQEYTRNCHSGKEYSQGFFRYLKEIIGMDKLIEEDGDRLKSLGYLEHAGFTVQLWNRVVSLLDQISEILGETECTGEMFFDILCAGIETMEISLIPTTADQVYVGNYAVGSFAGVKVLFASGLNDGLVPSSGSGSQIFSDYEKKTLNELAGEICAGSGSRGEREKLEIYKTISAPMDKAFLSFCSMSEDGEEQSPSQIVRRINKVFPEMETINVLSEDLTHKGEVVYNSRMEYMKLHPEKSTGILYAGLGKEFKNTSESISREHFVELYGENPKLSPTSLESFSRCPYAHFMRYGLKADERKVFEITPPEMGTVFHEALLRFSSYVSEKKLWNEADEKFCAKLMGEMAEASAREFKKGLMFEGPAGDYRISRITSVCEKTAYMIAEHIARGGFDRFSFEIPFGEGRELPGIGVETTKGSRVTIEGRIDRIDIAETDSGTYVKVIDYKSGDEKVSRKEISSGYKMQLMLYMTAALGGAEKVYRNVAPAGVFYFHIHEPVADGNSAKPKELEKFDDYLDTFFRKSFKMEGIAVNEPEIIDLLDSDFSNYSQIVRVRKLKDGTVKSSGDFSALSKDEFKELLGESRTKIEGICEDFVGGDVSVSPLNISNDEGACSYCKYKSICNFDVRLPGFDYRKS